MGGFLARDFKRQGDTLKPAPRVYTNVGIPVGAGLVGLRHPKRRNVNSMTREAAVTPLPSGLSGGPMLDTIELIKGKISIVGVLSNRTKARYAARTRT